MNLQRLKTARNPEKPPFEKVYPDAHRRLVALLGERQSTQRGDLEVRD